MTEYFPEGSLDAPSEASPQIWAEWDTFKVPASELHDNANELSAMAETKAGPENISQPFSSMARSGKICHESCR